MIKACLIQENFRNFIIHSKTFYLENIKLEILLQKTIETLNSKEIYKNKTKINYLSNKFVQIYQLLVESKTYDEIFLEKEITIKSFAI